MSDDSSRKFGDLKVGVVNSDDLIDTEKQRIDVRFSRPLAKVIKAEKAQAYEPKKWPMLGDGPDEHATNALGYPLGSWYEQKQEALRKKAEAEAQMHEAQVRQAALEEQQRQEEEQEQLTVRELEEIRRQAYEEGHKEGLEKGTAEGFARGLDKGTREGYDKGYNESLKKGYDDGLIKGREEGFEKGHAEGIQGGESIVLEQVERFRHLADALANPLRQVDRDVTDEIVYIVSRLAKTVIGRELKGDAGALRTAIEKAVGILPNAQKGAKISLNPDDLSLLLATLGRDYMQEQRWELESDESIPIGDVRVSNEASKVEWRVNDRIDALLDEFLMNASQAVNKALREDIPGCPPPDARLEPLAPPPELKSIVPPQAAEPAPEAQPQPNPQEGAAPAPGPQAAPAAANPAPTPNPAAKPRPARAPAVIGPAAAVKAAPKAQE